MHSRSGLSLIELIVALLILEIAGAAALLTAVSVERLTRHANHGSSLDQQRWQSYRAAELDSACDHRPVPDTIALDFPASDDRAALHTAVGCGQ